MLDSLRLWNLIARVPGLAPGAALHRAGLQALHDGRWDAAEHLLDLAAQQYGRELRVEPIARARVHQWIARARRGGQVEVEACLEVERRLYRLPRIERPEPPFELTDACELLASWSASAAPCARDTGPIPPGRAA